MNTRKTIRKILFITMWIVIGGGMITLLAAAMRQQKNERVKDVEITMNEGKDQLFMDKHDIGKILNGGTEGNVIGKARADLDLRKLEQMLEAKEWIRDAEIYFDNKNVLQVKVKERIPVARVFTTAGRSFYIDSDLKRLPLSDKLVTTVPVFTGFPDKKELMKKDSALLMTIGETAEFIGASSFWSSQVSQIDINPAREFEMIPVVGNHVVKLGDGKELDKKFHRLFVFYKNVLSKTGFDKYKTIDVQYTGQVVATKGFTTKVDSVQLRKNVEKLLQQARNMDFDTVITARSISEPAVQATTTTIRNEGLNEQFETEPVIKETPAKDPVVIKKTPAKQVEKPTIKKPTPVKQSKPPTEKKEPKAIMPKTDREQDYQVIDPEDKNNNN